MSPSDTRSGRTLVAHEWLAPTGGSENVVEEFLKVVPSARRVCLWNDAPARFDESFEETWLAKTPLRRSKVAALPFLSGAWRSVDLERIDRVLVSSHAFSHHLAARAAKRGIPSFAYVHSPARYVWAPEFDDRGQDVLARLGRGYFRRLDRRTVTDKVAYVANSKFVRERISNAWGVDAGVIYPPVEVELIRSESNWRARVSDPEELRKLDDLPAEFVLGASRLVEYKRLDSVIEAGSALGLPVVIAGRGPDEARLRAIAAEAPVPVYFFGFASTESLYALYQSASLFVFMAIEDFGIMPVEAMAAGTPVIVNATGGARESVELVGGGQILTPLEIGSLQDIPKFGASNADALAAFSTTSFRQQIAAWIGLAS